MLTSLTGITMETVITYRNTEIGVVLDKESTGEGRFIRQASDNDKYGHVILKIEPMKNSNTQSMFSWEVAEEEIPFAFFDGTLSGIRNYFEKEEFSGSHLYTTIFRDYSIPQIGVAQKSGLIMQPLVFMSMTGTCPVVHTYENAVLQLI